MHQLGDDNDLNRVLRTTKRSLEAAKVTPSLVEANRHILEAVDQLVFLMERLVDFEKPKE